MNRGLDEATVAGEAVRGFGMWGRCGSRWLSGGHGGGGRERVGHAEMQLTGNGFEDFSRAEQGGAAALSFL